MLGRSPGPREAELTTRLLRLREHRARLLAANRQQIEQSADGDESMRRRLIVRAERQIARIETALRPRPVRGALRKDWSRMKSRMGSEVP
jgi:hypothetical protein